jgi:hypothetical protein
MIITKLGDVMKHTTVGRMVIGFEVVQETFLRARTKVKVEGRDSTVQKRVAVECSTLAAQEDILARELITFKEYP